MLFSPKNIAFGLDIGDKTVKLVELRLIKNLKGEEHLSLTAFNEVAIPDECIVAGEIKNAPVAVAAIKNCVKGARGGILRTRAVVASLPESQSYIKIVSLPKGKRENITRGDVAQMLDQHLPVEAEKLYFDWRPVDANKIIVGAAPKNVIDSYTNIIEQADLIPLSLEIESMALARALLDKNDLGADKTKIFMDLGATRSAIIATYRGNPIVALNVPLAGDAITREISKSEKMPLEKAEELKISCGADPQKCPPKIKKIISSALLAAIKPIEDGLHYIDRLLQTKIDKIFICGGIAATPKITSILSDELKIKVRHADPLVNITLGKKMKFGSEDFLKYATAIGLAIRGTEQDVLMLK